MPANVPPLNGHPPTDDQVSFVSSILDFNSFSDYLAASAITLLAIVYLFGIFRIITDSDVRNKLLLFNAEIFDAVASVTASFFGVRPQRSSTTSKITKKIDDLTALIKSQSDGLSESSEHKIVGYFEQALKADFSKQISKSISDFTKIELTKAIENETAMSFEKARDRLSDAASSVAVRGVFSLIFGMLFAFGALLALRDITLSISAQEIDKNTQTSVIIISTLRVSIAIFITFVSYFFLSLYRRSLDEVKFYQNELANIDLWKSSYIYTSNVEDIRIKAYFVAKMLEIDRNFNLNLNNSKDVNQNLRISADFLKSIIDKIPSS